MPDSSRLTLPADLPSAEELLRVVLGISQNGIMLLRPVRDATGITIIDLAWAYLNPAAQQMLRLPERPPESFLTLFPMAEVAGVFGFYRDAFLSGQVARRQNNYQHDGLDGYYLLVAQRQGDVLVVNFTDTNDQARPDTVQELRASQARKLEARAETELQRQQLEQMLHDAPAMICVFDGPRHVFQFVNPPYQALVGPRPLLGKPIAEAMPELVGQPIFGLLDEVYRTGETFRAAEMLVQLDHGNEGRRELEKRYYNFIYQARHDQRGAINGIFVFAYDVTPQVLARQRVQELNEELAAINEIMAVANEELRDTNNRLTHTNVDLDTFVYTASHHLKAPIANIEGLLLALGEQLPAAVRQAPDVAHLLGLMSGSVTRFQRTLDHLIDVSKLQQAPAEPAEAVDLVALAEAVRLDLLPTLTAAGGRLVLDLAACPTVRFSPKNLRSIIYNLLSNAIKYRGPNRPPLPLVVLRSSFANSQVRLEVHDNGLGLDAEQQSKLFVMFQRLHTHVEGTGVGLYMVRRIVENAGGSIQVRSQPGIGTTFTVRLPEHP